MVNGDGQRTQMKTVDGETQDLCKAACLNERLQGNPCIGFVFVGSKCVLKGAEHGTTFKNMGAKSSGKMIAGKGIISKIMQHLLTQQLHF